MAARLCTLLPILCGLLVSGGCNSESELDLAELDSDFELPDEEGTTSSGEEADLTLKLQPGERFPLLKTVTHQLTQNTREGIVTHSSSLEMLIHVVVDEISTEGERKGQKKMSASYHRVTYRQNLDGEAIEFDSRNPVKDVPLDAQAYQGLVGNKFTFWLGPDNQIVDVPGFDRFLERCLAHVAPEHQQYVRQSLAATSGSDGIANFVDDSIGLLPNDARKPGDSWTLNRRVGQPLPMQVSTKYTLYNFTQEIAEVSIMGTISPSTTFERTTPANRSMRITVQGGRSYGNCTIDLRTGLPIHSEVEQTLKMRVQSGNQDEFDQQKKTIITVRYFPEQQVRGDTPGSIEESPQEISINEPRNETRN